MKPMPKEKAFNGFLIVIGLCKQVASILEEGVYCEKDFYLWDRHYEDEELHKLWAF